MLTLDYSTNYNIPKTKCFTANPNRLNVKTVSEALCNDYFQKQISPLENPLLYKFLSKNPKTLNSLLKKLYKSKLNDYDTILQENKIAKKHRVLLADPGITSRLDEFTHYIKEKEIQGTIRPHTNLRINITFKPAGI